MQLFSNPALSDRFINIQIKSISSLLFTFFLIFPGIPAFSQAEIIKDTVYFENNGKKLMVVNTLNRQYYNDSTCIWEIMYPEISNLGDMESAINLMLSREVALGDCNEKICDRSTMHFPLLNRYWDKVKIVSIKNDLLSYGLMEGSCPTYAKICFSKTTYHIYNLKTGMEVENTSLFRRDTRTLHQLDSVIASKLDFVPENPEMILSGCQFYLEGNNLFAFYDNYTLEGNKTFTVELQKKDILNLINPNSVLSVYFSEKKAGKK